LVRSPWSLPQLTRQSWDSYIEEKGIILMLCLQMEGRDLSVDTQPYIIAATRDLEWSRSLSRGYCLDKTQGKLPSERSIVLCVDEEEGGDAYLGCLITFALAFARNPARCLTVMTESDIGLIHGRMPLWLYRVVDMSPNHICIRLWMLFSVANANEIDRSVGLAYSCSCRSVDSFLND
jgi:hypothetical protein